MNDLLDLVRPIGQQAGGTAPAAEILLRVTVLLLAAMLAALVLRRSSAALRHLVWTLSLVGTLLVPLCYGAFPAWHWAILPQRQQAAPEIPLHSTGSFHPSDASAGASFEVPAIPRAAVTEHSLAPLSPQSTWSWPVFFAALWAGGSFLGLVWLGIGVVGAWYVAGHAQPAADSPWCQILQQLLAPCGCRRPVEVRQCSQVSVPMTWGLRRPVILVPAGSAAWPEETKRSVLLHELGHIRRGDCLMHLLGRLACVTYWFHPLVWLAARQLRKTSEQAADDVVLSSHIAPPEYAEHLVGIAGQMRGLHLFGHAALPMASPSDLEGRVRAILDPRRNHRSLKRKTCYALMILAMLLLIPCAILRLGYAQDKEPRAPTAAPKRLTEEEIAKQPPWVVVGRVADEQGQPIEGATVRAHCGIGTCFQTGIAETDKNGRYTLRFGPGMVFASEKAGEVPVGLQAATISAAKPGFVEKNLCRQGDLTMANRLPPPDYPNWWKPGRRTVLPNQPLALDFVLVRAATIDVELLDAEDRPIAKEAMWLSGKQLPPSCSILDEGKRGAQGQFRFEDVPPSFAWWFVVQVALIHANAIRPDEVRSPSMVFSQPEKYRVRLRLRRDAHSGLDLLEIVSVRNAKGDEVRDRVVADEWHARAPLPPALQAKGREILAKMAEANRYWLDRPPPEIRSYRYDFKLRGEEPQTYADSPNGRAAGAVRQGISYDSVLNGLTAHPERVAFRQIDVQPDTMILAFTLADGARVSAGNGVLVAWSGFFSTTVFEGTIIVDSKTYTLQECRSVIHRETYRETLSDYAEIRPRHFVPLRVHVSKGHMAFDFRFRVYEPGLWLFASSYLEDLTMIAQVDNVIVNGERARQPAPAATEGTNVLGPAKAETTNAAPPVPPPALPATSGKAATPEGKRVDLAIVVARHVLLLEGKKIITWGELEKMIAALPDPSQAYPHFYITRGADEAGIETTAKEQIWRLHRTFKLKGHSEGSLWPRTEFRYDQIKTAADLVPDEHLRVEGQVLDGKGAPVAAAEVLLMTPVDKSIPYKSYHVELVEGRVRNPLEHVMTHSDDHGRFALFPAEHGEFYVVALHPTAGFGLERRKGFSDRGKVRLLSWATLVSRFEGDVGQRQEGSLSTRVREDDGLPEVSFNQYWSDLKKESPTDTFRFTHVPPIFDTTISRDFPSEQGGSIGLTGATVGLLPGETRRLDLAPLSDKQREQLEQMQKESRLRH